jgi:hypothetical protein
MHPAEMIGDDLYLHGDGGIEPLIAGEDVTDDPGRKG